VDRPTSILALAICGIGCGITRGGTGNDLGLDAAPNVDSSTDSTVVDTRVEDTGVEPDTMPIVDTTPEADAPCKPIGGGNLCDGLPKFEGTPQVVDGFGDEFCSVPTTHFDPTKGELMFPSPAPTWVKSDVRARFAWTGGGMHAHIQVTDTNIQVVDDADFLWKGDAVEVYVAGFTPLTGLFDGTSDAGAMQIVIAPPSGPAPARAEIFQNTVHVGSLGPGKWAVRIVPDGYEIELRIPWTDLGAPGDLKVGASIGLTIALVDKDVSPDRFWSVYKMSPIPSGSCGQPSCDDRLWCFPKLK